MLRINQRKISFFVVAIILLITSLELRSQSYAAWYNSAQERIDTLRKGDFGVLIFDKDGQPFTGDVSVRMKKHEYPFGIAFDFYEGNTMGNSYSTQEPVFADRDSIIYQSERWSDYLAYAIPIESGKEYKVTLKFAEIFHSAADARIFDVEVEGQLFLDNFDTYAVAGGKNIATDTSINVTPVTNVISIELVAVKDNVAIKGIEITEVGGENIYRINCGGAELTTKDGNVYTTENGLFNPPEKTVASKEDWMKAAMYKYFNYGACGNAFKWSGIQPQYTAPNYTNFENAVKWTQKVGWELRAHTLLWGGDNYEDSDHELPRWVKDLPTPQAIYDTCKMRVVREVSRYKGTIKEYDVMNEPVHKKYLASVVGDSINWECFKWARSADPDAELFLNDFNVEYNWGQAAEYRDLILKIKEMGGPITGVGMQAHFWECCRPNVDELVKNVNIVAEAGLPIRFTEFDYSGEISQEEQAKDFILVLTVAFSHPSISGMISWGLSDEGAWRENTGFFDANYKPKVAADTLLYYTKKLWATNFDTTLSAGNQLDFNAYYGKYDIEVTFDDTVKVFTVSCLKDNKDSVFTLHEADARLKGPVLVSTELDGDNVVKLTFDKAIDNSTIKRGDFKFFSNSEVGISDVRIDVANSNTLLVVLSKSVTKGEYISVSYFPGDLKGENGGMAEAFGPEGIFNPVTVDLNPKIYISSTDMDIKVYPNPTSDVLHVECMSAPYRISVLNSIGTEIYSGSSETTTSTLDISNYQEGMYIIKLTNDENAVGIMKIIKR